jgi:hypothetical protein
VTVTITVTVTTNTTSKRERNRNIGEDGEIEIHDYKLKGVPLTGGSQVMLCKNRIQVK